MQLHQKGTRDVKYSTSMDRPQFEPKTWRKKLNFSTFYKRESALRNDKGPSYPRLHYFNNHLFFLLKCFSIFFRFYPWIIFCSWAIFALKTVCLLSMIFFTRYYHPNFWDWSSNTYLILFFEEFRISFARSKFRA